MHDPNDTVCQLGQGSSMSWVTDVIDAAPVGMLMIGPDGVIRMANRELERMFGYEHGELLGEKIEILVPTRAHSKHVEHRDAYIDRPTERRMGGERELFGVRKDGSEVPVDVGLKPIEKNGERRVIATVVDVTNSRLAEQRQRELNAKLEEKNEELEHYVHSISHDLKSPLLTIDGFVDLIEGSLDRPDADAIREHLRRISGATQRMRETMNGLLELSRLGAPSGDARTDLGVVIARTLSMFESQIAPRTISVRVMDGAPILKIDQFRASQVVENLVGNALRHGRPEVGEQRIEIGFREDDREFVFYVRDNGPGVPEEGRDEIFGLFKRLSTAQPGSGVGLSIVRRVARVHGGRVWVESEPGDGATFCFALPRRSLVEHTGPRSDAA